MCSVNHDTSRYTAVDKLNNCDASVQGARANSYFEEKDLHAKYDLGKKKVYFSNSIIIDQSDAQSFENDEEITLMNWGNAIVRQVNHSVLKSVESVASSSTPVDSVALELHLQGNVKDTKKKITWLSKEQTLVPVELYDFDYLITKDKLEEDDRLEDFLNPHTETRIEAWADCNVAELRQNDVLQLDRRGYYRVDRPFAHGRPAALFKIPTGRA